MSDAAASPASPAGTIPAATVVIFRQAQAGPPELLMVQRAKAMRFAGGAAVFPGGRIDPSDHTLAATLSATGDHAGIDDLAARIAGIRETLEETGLAIGLTRPVSGPDAERARALLAKEGALAPVLAQMGWTLAVEALIPFARWCPQWPGAFDTFFHLADLGSGAVDLLVDNTENSRLFWMSAADALTAADNGEISVIFPTRRNLERLALFASFAEARSQAEAIPVRMITPAKLERDGEPWLTIPDGLGYPVLGQPLASVQRG